MIVNNVTLVFLPSGALPGESINAPGQQVYIDLTPGTMTRLQSNAQGKLVGVPPAASAVSLDDTRTYQVVVSPTVVTPAPSSSQGVAARVTGGKLAVAPRIAVKISRTGGSSANIACELKIGTTTTNVTTTSAGWIMSNDAATGEVMIRSNTLLLRPASSADPVVTLAISPSPPTRGSSATITPTIPAGAAAFKVTEWKYAIFHTNPGASSPSTANVVRPASESASTFDQNWQGEFCASGTVRMRFVTGAVVRTSGSAAVSATLVAVDPIEVTLAVTVDPRTGTPWTTGLTEDPVGALNIPITSFHDTGRHTWTPGAWSTSPPRTIAAGPNRGCQFLTSATASFTSTPQINASLSDATSAFSMAQDRAYLTSPLPVRVIPRHLYTVGTGGVVNEITAGSIATHFGLTTGASISAHCISQPTLLAGTRRHESEDPAPGEKSHKGNCLKALRALEPVKFAEALVQVPGSPVNFGQRMQARVNLVAGVAGIHTIVDETQTAATHSISLVSGQTIIDVNADSNGNLVGPVWNPTTNSELRN